MGGSVGASLVVVAPWRSQSSDPWRFEGFAFFLKKQKGAGLEGGLGQVPTWDSEDAGC